FQVHGIFPSYVGAGRSMGLGKADPAALDGGLNRCGASDMASPGKRQFGKCDPALRSPEIQNGLITTRTTINATATPGTSLSSRSRLPDSDRSPFASLPA